MTRGADTNALAESANALTLTATALNRTCLEAFGITCSFEGTVVSEICADRVSDYAAEEPTSEVQPSKTRSSGVHKSRPVTPLTRPSQPRYNPRVASG